MLIVLDSTSKSIRGVLGAAHTTNAVDFTVTYADSTVTSFTEASAVAQSNGTTNTEILAAPASSTQRVIKSITVWNHDTVDQTITLYLRVTATDYGFYSETIEAGGFRFLDDLQSTAAASGGGDMVLADIQTVTGAKTFNSGKFILAGATSGSTTVNAASTASGTLTLPAATDTLVGKATTDTLTNKTFNADGTGNSITNIENADIKEAAAIALNKLAALTASELVVTDANGFLTNATGVSATEAGYLNGVTSAIQTQIDTKAPYQPTGTTYSPSSGSQTVALDVTSNNMHIVNGHANGTAITFTITGAANNQPFVVSILQGGTTVSTIAGWFATIRWAGGVAPTLTPTLNKRDTFGFIRTGANTYDGFVIGQNC